MLTVADGKQVVWGDIPLTDLAFGNAMDCDFTLRLYHRLRGRLKEVGADVLYDELVKKSSMVLVESEFNGMYVDTEYLDELDARLSEKKDALAKELQELSGLGDEFNPQSPDSIIEALFSDDKFGTLPVSWNAKSGKPSTSADDLGVMLYEVKQAL